MWDLIVSVPDRCLSFYFSSSVLRNTSLLVNNFMAIRPSLEKASLMVRN